MKTGGICLKCKQPIVIAAKGHELFCGICWKEMNERIKAKRIELGKDTRGKELVEAGVGSEKDRR